MFKKYAVSSSTCVYAMLIQSSFETFVSNDDIRDVRTFHRHSNKITVLQNNIIKYYTLSRAKNYSRYNVLQVGCLFLVLKAFPDLFLLLFFYCCFVTHSCDAMICFIALFAIYCVARDVFILLLAFPKPAIAVRRLACVLLTNFDNLHDIYVTCVCVFFLSLFIFVKYQRRMFGVV